MSSSLASARLKELLPQLFGAQSRSGWRCLHCQLNADWQALLPLNWVSEAITATPAAITPVPHLPPCALGWIGWRDRVICVTDLADLLGISEGESRQPASSLGVVPLVVVRTPSKSEAWLGLAVRRLYGTLRVSVEEIVSPAGQFPESLTPYLQGYWQHQGKNLLILDVAAIAAAPALRAIAPS